MNESSKRLRPWTLDRRALSIFRILLGIIYCIDLVVRLPDINTFYTDQGALPRHAFPAGSYIAYGLPLSIHYLSGSHYYQLALFALAFFLGVLLIRGVKPRLVLPLCWYMLISLHARNPLLLNGGDVFFAALLLWSSFLPMTKTDSRPADGLATFALYLQVIFLYLVTSYLKLSPEWFTQGTAIEYSLRFDFLVTPFGKSLLAFPLLLKILTWGTISLEVSAPLLLLLPPKYWKVRTALALSLIGMHLGSDFCLGLGIFGYVTAAAWVALLPEKFFDRFLGSITETTGVSLNQPAKACLALLLFIVSLSNLEKIFPSLNPVLRYPPLAAIQGLLHLNQNWSMFAPAPKDTGWFVISGQTASGKTVDILNLERAFSAERPEHTASMFKTVRWERFLLELWREKYAALRPFFMDFLCRRWNNISNDKLEAASFVSFIRPINLSSDAGEFTKTVIWQGSCQED